MGNQCCSSEQVVRSNNEPLPIQQRETLENDSLTTDKPQQKRYRAHASNDVKEYLSQLTNGVSDQLEEKDINQIYDNFIKLNSQTTTNEERIQKKIKPLCFDSPALRLIYNLQFDEKQFKDESFRPCLRSLTEAVNQFNISKDITWYRIHEIIKENEEIKVFSGKIEPNDIIQGSLGDCYFLSALSTLAEHPNLISRLFDITEYNPAGFYCVWLNHDGIWRQVIVDDYFPCNTNTTLAFSKCNGPELWVVILEKAYAKLHQNYDNIQGGYTEEAVCDLTGSPYDIISTEDIDATWDYLYKKVEHEKVNPNIKYILNAASRQDQEGGIEVEDEEGIVSGHAYSILDAKVVETDEGEERIIQIRNPWGEFEWTGPWSDKSDKWTPELKQIFKFCYIKKLCNFSDKDDGLFWMSIESFCEKYTIVSCNYVHLDYYYNSKKIDFEQNSIATIQVSITSENTTGYIQFHQRDLRNFTYTNKQNLEEFNPQEDELYYSNVELQIYKGTPQNPVEYIDSIQSNYRNGYCKINFDQAGDYFVAISVDWDQFTIDKSIAISLYTNENVHIQEEIQFFDDYSVMDNFLMLIPVEGNNKKICRDKFNKSKPSRSGNQNLINHFFNRNQQINQF